jgi:hypothetical protein
MADCQTGLDWHKADRSLAYSVRWQQPHTADRTCRKSGKHRPATSQEGSSARTASAYRQEGVSSLSGKPPRRNCRCLRHKPNSKPASTMTVPNMRRSFGWAVTATKWHYWADSGRGLSGSMLLRRGPKLSGSCPDPCNMRLRWLVRLPGSGWQWLESNAR